MAPFAEDRAEETLQRNLQELARSQPELARRLALPVEGDHVRVDGAGRTLLAIGRGWIPLEVEASARAEAADQAVDEERGAERVFVFGIGVGDQLAAVLEELSETTVTAWERDPWLLRLALSRHDWTAALASGRLALSLGRDLTRDLRGLPSSVVRHPLLSELYGPERRALERRLASPGPASVSALRPVAALGLGELFVDDVAEALEFAGYDVVPLDLGRWALEELTESLVAADARVLFAINYRDGLAEFCEQAGIPLVCWEIDPTTDRDVRIAGPVPGAHVYTWRAQNVGLFRSAGAEHVSHLPLAANVRRHRPLASELSAEERDRYAVPVAFVGASMVARASQLRVRFLELHAALLPAVPLEQVQHKISRLLAAQRTDGTRYVLPELAEAEFSEFFAALDAHDVREDPIQLLAETAAAERRLGWAAGIAPRGLHVWGDADWTRIEQSGVVYRGPAGHRFELTKIYGAAQINVDIGRIYQRDIVTMRVFDVLACGGFLIAEHSDDLASLFEIGREIESYRTPAELDEKTGFYLAHPERAREIAAAGLRAVRERHTIEQRVATMLAELEPERAQPAA